MVQAITPLTLHAQVTQFKLANMYPCPAAPRGAPSIVLPHQEASYVRHIALDIGGSLIKLVYFSPDSYDSQETTTATQPGRHGNGHQSKGGELR